MSVRSSIELWNTAKAVAKQYDPNADETHDAVAAAIRALRLDPNADNPPIADWILLGQWLIEQAALALETFLSVVDMILQAIAHWLEEPPPP